MRSADAFAVYGMDAVSRGPAVLARPYRWLECDVWPRPGALPLSLSARTGARRPVLGDGDGRFLARLLRANPELEADVVDCSTAMLRLLRERLRPEDRQRVALHQVDARKFAPPRAHYDLVAAHFFFDCLFQSELNALVERIAPRLAPGARWVVSEFAKPRGRVGSVVGRGVVSGLYGAFGLLTGLRVRSLPNHGAEMEASGFQLLTEQQWLRGLLVSQLWQH